MRFVLFLFVLALAGCDDLPAGPDVAVDQQFTLAPSETAVIQGTGVRVQFVNVTGDSRCPADALCITGGDAIVHVRVYDDGSTPEYELHTGDTARASAVHRQLRVSLTQLQPYPFSSRTISPGDYRATFTVTRN